MSVYYNEASYEKHLYSDSHSHTFPAPNSRHLSELLYSWNDHEEALELCLGFYTFKINHILRIYHETNKQFTKGEAQIANHYFF